MTPEELDAFLRVARAHGATAFRYGDVYVDMAPPRASQAAPTPTQVSSPATSEELMDRAESLLFAHERFSG